MFINVLRFVHVKANSRKICEEISFPFFLKNVNVSSFLRDSRLTISEKLMATPTFLCGFQYPS